MKKFCLIANILKEKNLKTSRQIFRIFIYFIASNPIGQQIIFYTKWKFYNIFLLLFAQ